ncbi:MAG: peptidoglycan DD-metalloendopeptidase family protein [Flavobacteriaceae bacterium]
MTAEEKILQNLSDTSLTIIDHTIPKSRFTGLDLSINNPELINFDITDPAQCQAYIDLVLQKNKALAAYGGYLEERNLYKNSANFAVGEKEVRNIHLGLDIWAPAGTAVLVPCDAKVHSFAENPADGDYGPTIILEHKTANLVFYALYGHLSRDSLRNMYKNKPLSRGEVLANLGFPAENGHYAAHLHFQLILDLEGSEGDYPGVCSKSDLNFYRKNCPNPNLLLNI